MSNDEEKKFLASYDIHDFDLPLTTVDVVIFSVQGGALQVLLVKRGTHPFKGVWSLPGGFIDIKKDRDLEAVALRKLKEKTSITTPYLEQLQAWGNRDRDPRGWSATFAYFALIPSDSLQPTRGQDIDEVGWWPVLDALSIKELAFDHALILNTAIARLQSKVEYTSLPVHLLPEEFTLADLQKVYEIVMGHPVDKSAFRKRVMNSGMLKELDGKFKLGSNRPAQLFTSNTANPIFYFQRTFGISTRDE